ncbi:MAG TPA: hypothetical protein VGG33_27100 [Polyangia bacterium]
MTSKSLLDSILGRSSASSSAGSWLRTTAVAGLLGGVGVALFAPACGSNAGDPMMGAGGTPMPGGTGGTTGTPDGGGGPGDPTPDANDPVEPEVQATACPVFTPFQLSPQGTDGAQPAIIWTGTQYLAVWSGAPAGMGASSSNIVGAFLNPDGSRVAGAADLEIADTPNLATSPELTKMATAAGAPESYAVVFENCEGTGVDPCAGGTSVVSVVLGADGLAKGAPITLSPTAPVQRRPYVASGLGNTYVTFRDRAAGPAGPRTVARLGRLDDTGALVGTGLAIDEASDGHYPFVAVGPERVALAYQRNKVTPEIVLALFDPTLAPFKEIAVRTGLPSDATNPVVQWNTNRWVIAWEDEREDEAKIYATVVDPDGATAGVPEAAYQNNGNWPAVASSSDGTSLIGFYGYPGRRVFLARVQANGMLKPGQVVLGVGKFPSVAYNSQASEYAVVYENENRVMFARFKCAD